MAPDLSIIANSLKIQAIRELIEASWHKYPDVPVGASAGALNIIENIVNDRVVRVSPISWTGKFLKKQFNDDHPIYNWIEWIEVKDGDTGCED
jgi:hypothetical protein